MYYCFEKLVNFHLCFRSLRYLAVNDMKGVKQKPLVAILLEEMLPECKIEGLTYIGMENYEWETDTHIPVFLLGGGEPQEGPKDSDNRDNAQTDVNTQDSITQMDKDNQNNIQDTRNAATSRQWHSTLTGHF